MVDPVRLGLAVISSAGDICGGQSPDQACGRNGFHFWAADGTSQSGHFWERNHTSQKMRQ